MATKRIQSQTNQGTYLTISLGRTVLLPAGEYVDLDESDVLTLTWELAATGFVTITDLPEGTPSIPPAAYNPYLPASEAVRLSQPGYSLGTAVYQQDAGTWYVLVALPSSVAQNWVAVATGVVPPNSVTIANILGLQAALDSKATVAALTASNQSINSALSALQSSLMGVQASVGTKASASDLATLTTLVGTKASASDLATLTTLVGTKADLSALTAVGTTVSGIQTTLASMQTSLAGKALQSDLATTQGSVSAIQTTISQIQTTLGGKAEASAVSSLSSTLTTVQSTVLGLQTAVAAKANSSALTSLSNQVATLQSQVDALNLGGGGGGVDNSTILSITTSLATLTTQVNSLAAQVSSAASASAVTAVANNLSTLTTNFTLFKEAAEAADTALGGRVGALETAVSAIEAEDSSLDGRVDTLETSVSGLSTTVGGHTASLSGLDGRVGTLETAAASTATTLAGKQDTLVSGTSVKTVDGVTLLGAGNLATTPEFSNILNSPLRTSGTYTGTLRNTPYSDYEIPEITWSRGLMEMSTRFGDPYWTTNKVRVDNTTASISSVGTNDWDWDFAARVITSQSGFGFSALTYTANYGQFNSSVVVDKDGVTISGDLHASKGVYFTGYRPINIGSEDVTLGKVGGAVAAKGTWTFASGSTVNLSNASLIGTFPNRYIMDGWGVDSLVAAYSPNGGQAQGQGAIAIGNGTAANSPYSVAVGHGVQGPYTLHGKDSTFGYAQPSVLAALAIRVDATSHTSNTSFPIRSGNPTISPSYSGSGGHTFDELPASHLCFSADNGVLRAFYNDGLAVSAMDFGYQFNPDASIVSIGGGPSTNQITLGNQWYNSVSVRGANNYIGWSYGAGSESNTFVQGIVDFAGATVFNFPGGGGGGTVSDGGQWNSILIPSSSNTSETLSSESVVVGGSSYVGQWSERSTVIGTGAGVGTAASDSVAIGSGAQVDPAAGRAVAVGVQARVFGSSGGGRSSAFGYSAKAMSDWGVAVGAQSTSYESSTVVGVFGYANPSGCAFGYNAIAPSYGTTVGAYDNTYPHFNGIAVRHNPYETGNLVFPVRQTDTSFSPPAGDSVLVARGDFSTTELPQGTCTFTLDSSGNNLRVSVNVGGTVKVGYIALT